VELARREKKYIRWLKLTRLSHITVGNLI